jgi:hypothetical protein
MSSTRDDWSGSLMQYYGSLLLLYAINHGWILLLAGGIYWDDWTLYMVPSDVLVERAAQAGSTWWYPLGHIQAVLLSAGPWVYRVITLCLMFGAGVALDRILRAHQDLHSRSRYLIVLLFLILPLYWARVALIDIHYTICYFLFFLAWALMTRYRAISLALFFLSFSTNSLLVFFALPAADRCMNELRGDFRASRIGKCILRNIDFALLPLVYFAIKNIWFRPYGIYAGYNEGYALANLILRPIEQWNDFIDTAASAMLGLRLSSTNVLSLPFGVSLVSAAIAVALFTRACSPLSAPVCTTSEAGTIRRRLVVAGLVASIAGAFPYWIVGKAPTFSDWGSRHQLLLPLGTACLIAAALAGAGHCRRPAIATTIALCTLLNCSAYMSYLIDWHKQRGLTAALRGSDLVSRASVVVFVDDTLDFNARARRYRYYEWCGLLAYAFGDNSRLGADEQDLIRFTTGDLNSEISSRQLPRHVDLSSSTPLDAVRVTISHAAPTSRWQRLLALGLPAITVEVEETAPVTIAPLSTDSMPRVR